MWGQACCAPGRGLVGGVSPQEAADSAALLAALMSAFGSGAHTYPPAHVLGKLIAVVVALQVTTSCIPFMPFCTPGMPP